MQLQAISIIGGSNMSGFSKFILYNLLVYIIYWIIDRLFTFLNLYSSKELGQDLFVMPTDSDLILIVVNIVLSMVAGFVVMRWIESRLS